VKHLGKADGADQKRLRDGLRGLGFYVSDHAKVGQRFALSDLQALLDESTLRIWG